MVAPDREMPGSNASDWLAPTRTAVRKLSVDRSANSSSCCSLVPPASLARRSVRRRMYSAPRRMAAFTIRKAAATRGVAKRCFNGFSRKTPKMPVGMVPTISSIESRSGGVSMRPRRAARKKPRVIWTHSLR